MNRTMLRKVRASSMTATYRRQVGVRAVTRKQRAPVKREYPYRDANGTLHMSRHVELFIDVAAVRADLEASGWEDDFDRQIRRTHLGSWYHLSPSGKTYAPWACSNVDACPVCGGSGSIRSRRKRRLRVKYRNRAKKLRTKLLAEHGPYFGGTWPTLLCVLLSRWDEYGRATHTCPRCQGIGSAEACDDDLFQDGLELFLENEADLFIEQEDGDIFVVQTREATEEEEAHE